jgi:hypothetical protein
MTGVAEPSGISEDGVFLFFVDQPIDVLGLKYWS